MATTLKQLADLVTGVIEGNADLQISHARSLKEAEPGDIAFLDSAKNQAELQNCKASAVVVPVGITVSGKSVIQVADPLFSFIAIFQHLHGRPPLPAHGIDARADLHASVVLGTDTNVHAFAAIGEGTTLGARCRIHSNVTIGRFCKIGDDVTLHPGVVVYDGAVIGSRVIVHANAVLGADGFGYRFDKGRHVKIPQLGTVEIGDDVEIGACTTIDRGAFQPTRVGSGTKIDNLVMVAHNCQVGNHNLFISQMGMAGSSSTGDYVVVAGQVGVTDHVHLGKGSIIGAKAGITKDVPPGQRYLGAPARPEKDAKRLLMTLDKLPEFRRDLRRIKKKLGLDDDGEE